MKLRPSLFSLALLALLWGTATVERLQAATITLIDGMAATASSPNFVHSDLFWIQALDPALASRPYGPMAAAYYPLSDRSGGGSREMLSNLVKYRESGPSPALVRSTDQLAVSPSFSFVSIAVADNGDVLETATTLPDSFPLVDLNPGPAPALPETPEEDPPSAYIMLAACLLALAMVGWRRSRGAGSL